MPTRSSTIPYACIHHGTCTAGAKVQAVVILIIVRDILLVREAMRGGLTKTLSGHLMTELGICVRARWLLESRLVIRSLFHTTEQHA